MILKEKNCELDRYYLCMNQNADNCEFSINESKTWYIYKEKEEIYNSLNEDAWERAIESSIVHYMTMEKMEK